MFISLNSMHVHVVVLKRLVNQPLVLLQTLLWLFNCPPLTSAQGIFVDHCQSPRPCLVPGSLHRTYIHSFSHLKLPAISKVDIMYYDYLDR